MMLKRITTLMICLVLLSSSGWAQTGMTDNQVLQFVMSEREKGTSQSQIVTRLLQRGVTAAQIRKVRRMYSNMQKGTINNGTTIGNANGQERMRVNNGVNRLETGKAFPSKSEQNYEQYIEEQSAASVYSQGRISGYTAQHSYDENDPEYIELENEMNEWVPQDTAMLVKHLQNQLEYYQNKKSKKKVFGRDIFNRRDLTFEPEMNLATPQSYVLGPGDVVNIDIWGTSRDNISTTISPDGTITVENGGVIELSGLTVAQAKQRLKSRLGSFYQGSNIQMTLGQTRTITINVLGEVKKPGSYTLSAFASVFHALHMAGGIGDLGTLRNIKVFRGGRLLSVIDVYDYMLNGKMTGNIRLADNDIVQVGTYDNLVNISGKIKRPMWYEMKANESLATILRYAGGYTGDAYTKYTRVYRKAGGKYAVFNVEEFDANSFRLYDNDSVAVDSIIARYENMVEVKGAIFRPGMYQLGENINSVRTLVQAASGVTEFAIARHGIIQRMKPDRKLQTIAVDIEGIMNETVPDVHLQSEDVLFVPTRTDVQEEETFTILGEVQHPGKYVYSENTTIEDLILQAGGLKNSASTKTVEVARRTSRPGAEKADSIIARTYTFALKEGFIVDGEPSFTLQPFDEVYVHKSAGYTDQQSVTVEGEVMFAGIYALSNRETRLSDVVKKAGGPNHVAYVKGARLERKLNNDERVRLEESLQLAREQQQRNMLQMAQSSSNAMAIAQLSERQSKTQLERFHITSTYSVGIELDKALAHPGSDDDVVLRDGDRIVIPQYNGTVRVNGAVLHPNTVAFKAGKKVKYYIEQAGGYSTDAKKSQTYILYMNGMIAKVGSKTKVTPGCEIVVPTKPMTKMTAAERMMMATSATSLGTMAASIANLLKK